MAYTNVRRLKRVQAGIQVSRGTNVAATRRVYGTIVRQVTQAVEEINDESGTFWDGATVVQGDADIGFTLDAIATYEDLPWWLQIGLDGSLAGVSDADTPPAYTYTADPSGSADDLDVATFEYGWGSLVYESGNVVINSMTIACDRASTNTWKITADMIARDWVVSTFTGAIGERTREAIRARATKLYIDEPGGTIGTTEILDTWRSWSVTIQNNIEPKRFGEDDEFIAIDFARGKQMVTGEVVLEHSTDGEFAKQRLMTSRKVRFQQSGTLIHDTPDVYKRCRIDLPNLYWNAPAENIIGENIVNSFGFVAKPTGAGAAPIVIETVNDLATLV